jgi:hypothetical protein
MSARKYVSDAAKQAAYRARSNSVTLTVQVPFEVSYELDLYLKYRLESKSEVIVKLLRTQLLRKR